MIATTPPPRSSSTPSLEPPGEITRLLDAWQNGDADALDDLMVRLYRDLRRIAQGLVSREQRVPTLQATALVHEIFLRLDASSGSSAPDGATRWRTRRHFFAVASMMMRRMLIDAARRRAMKRRHGFVAIDSDDAAATVSPAPVAPAEELILVHVALERLAEQEPDLAKVVELRWFLGLDCAETAAVLEVSERTVKRRWRKAKAELSTILRPSVDPT